MEKQKKVIRTIAYYSFYLAVVIEVLLVLVDKSSYTNPIEGQFFRLTFLLFFLKVCLTKYSVKEYLVIVLFMSVGAISYFITGRNEVIRIVTFIAACKDINMMKCLKLVFWMTLAGCIIIMILSLTGVLGTVLRIEDYGRGDIQPRYVLGMGHPNALQCMVCVLTILGTYLYHAKWKWYGYAGTILLNSFFFWLTNSRTAFLISVCAVVLLFGAIRFKKKIWERIFALGNIGIFVGSIALSLLSAKDAMCLWHYYWEGASDKKINFYLFLDTILTGRLHSLIETDRHEGIMATWRLFSGPENNYYFDMGWVRLFYWYGIIPGCIAVIVLLLFIIYFVKNRKFEELVCFSMLALYTVAEAHIVSVYIARNYLLFFLGMYWCSLLTKLNLSKNARVKFL